VLGRRVGRQDELRGVYQRHVDAVYAFFAYSVADPVAEDLTSTAFEKVLKAWPSFDSARGSERTWILAIARNVLMDHFRRERYRKTVSTDAHPALLDALEAVGDGVERVLASSEVRELVSGLGEREREVLALRFGADLQAADIAELLGLSASNVHQILSRCLRRLREDAEREGGIRSSA
jgi:RNA polymerase sigma-70 factor (ECF subfamily)